MDLICISLMTSDAEPLLMYLLDICMSSLEECPLRSLAHFKNEIFFFLAIELCESERQSESHSVVSDSL